MGIRKAVAPSLFGATVDAGPPRAHLAHIRKGRRAEVKFLQPLPVASVVLAAATGSLGLGASAARVAPLVGPAHRPRASIGLAEVEMERSWVVAAAPSLAGLARPGACAIIGASPWVASWDTRRHLAPMRPRAPRPSGGPPRPQAGGITKISEPSPSRPPGAGPGQGVGVTVVVDRPAAIAAAGF